MVTAPPAGLDAAVNELQHGYCLWIGAGVPIHLGAMGGERLPTWSNLIDDLERAAAVPKPPPDAPFPSRIDKCLAKLGRIPFQRKLRELLLSPLTRAIVSAAKSRSSSDLVPSQVRDVAHLGVLANPIVNFNLEQYTSHMIADPCGLAAIKSFQVAVPGSTALGVSESFPVGNRFERHVYHPHGALDDTGICILGEREYRAMNGTLAFQLAAHAAFGNRLAIVGMSLEDDYLRAQIANFRAEIGKISWFVVDLSAEARTWAWRYDIDVIQVPDWNRFWQLVRSALPAPPERDLLQMWQIQVIRAFEVEHFKNGEYFRSMAVGSITPLTPHGLVEHTWLALLRGEEGDLDSARVEASSPRSKELEALLTPIAEAITKAS